MQFVRETWGPENAQRNGSILKALVKRWPERDVEAMIRGAALLGWQDLRAVNSAEGLGRRMAQAAYWQQANRAPSGKLPKQVGQILRGMLDG